MADLVPGLAAKYGVPEWLIRGMVSAEGGTNRDGSFRTSPAGAFGPAQLMPGTAASLQKRYGIDPRTYAGNLEGGVAYLGEQLRRFKSPELALAAYNAGPGAVQKYGGIPPYAETQNYVKKIMGSAKAGGARGGGAPVVAAPAAPAISPATDPRAAKRAFATQLLQARRSGDRAGMMAAVRTYRDALSAPRAPLQLQAHPGQVGGYAAVTPPQGGTGAWGGSYDVARGFADVATGLGLRVTSEKRDRQMTKSGNPSDHWTGSKNAYAFDLSDGYATKNMDLAAQRIAARLGVNYSGGPLELTKVVNGYRIQVLYRTNTGGNHFNHLHVGVSRV